MPTNNNDSYSGIVSAFNQVRRDSGLAAKHYPASYEGIREAVLDMSKDWAGADPSPYPPGWEPTYDAEGNPAGGDWAPGFTPSEGDLWFDSRQGRLMVFVDDAYYQANGADTLTRVQNTPPSQEVEGALWYSPDANDLYLYDGTNWVLVSTSTIETTNLILGSATTSAFSTPLASLLPAINTVNYQADYNQWLFQAIKLLGEGVVSGSGAQVVVSGTAPTTDLEDGDLWFNTNETELFVYQTNSWIATTSPLQSDATIVALQQTVATLDSTLTTNTTSLQSQITAAAAQPHHVYELKADAQNRIYLEDDDGTINSISVVGQNGVTATTANNTLTIEANALLTTVNAINADYLTASDKTTLETEDQSLQTQIDAITAVPKATQAELQQLDTTLTTAIGTLATQTSVALKLPLAGGTLTGDLSLSGNQITNVGAPTANGDAANKQYIDTFKTEVANTYVRADAPTFDSIVIQKLDVTQPAFDLSSSAATGNQALKLKSNDNGASNTTTFGTNSNYWEYAWEFQSLEDYCWKHSTNGKIVSINKDGLYCDNLVIGDFQPNTVNGMSAINQVNVGTTLANHASSITTLTTDVNNLKTNADNTNLNQIYYSDAAPGSANINNGDLWFDSSNLRLNVRHGGFWVFPDRVEDVALKSALFTAVNNSTDYASLKSGLLSALT